MSPACLDGLDIPKLKAYAERADLEFVAVFGSRSRGEHTSRSDFDLALMPERWDAPGSRLEATVALAQAMGRGDLDAAWLPRASWLLCAQVARDGQPIYERRAGAFRRFCLGAIFEASDSDHWRRRQVEGIRRSLSKTRVVDNELIRAKLAQLTEALNTMRPWLGVSRALFTEDAMRYWASERALMLLIENACSINAEAASGAGIPPSDYYSSFLSAASAGWIPSEVAQQLAPLVLLRNALVHAYEKVDLASMYDRMQASLPWWDAYVASVLGRL